LPIRCSGKIGILPPACNNSWRQDSDLADSLQWQDWNLAATLEEVAMNHELVRRRDLPHWDVPDAAYFVTTCLEGSIPAQGLLDIARFRRDLGGQRRPEKTSEETWKANCWKKCFARMDEWLDRQPPNKALERPELAIVVVNSMRYFAEERYDLLAYVVMPSHIHWVFQPRREWIGTFVDYDNRTPRERITYSLNRFTAGKCNKLLNRTGPFWQHESFDHWVRDLDELDRIMRYIEENPVKAGLVAAAEPWPYSSAYIRANLGLEWGMPIPKTRQSS
jgi:putative transposase